MRQSIDSKSQPGLVNLQQLNVVHSMHIWLPQTMTWLNTQINALPENIESYIICDEVENLDQFPAKNIGGMFAEPRHWRMLSRWSWQIGRRRKRHLLQRCIEKTDSVILHSHFGDRAWANIEVASRTSVGHIVSFYGYDVGQLPRSSSLWRDRFAALFGQADRFLCEGPNLGRELCELGCPPEKIRVHHLGVDLSKFPYRPRQWSPGTALRVLLAGSFVEKKGFPIAIDALGRLKGKIDLSIDIVGDSDGQPRSDVEKAKILSALKRNDLTANTRLHGYQSHQSLIRIADKCHIFLTPSITASDGDSEGGAPVTIIEMAALGVPIVSTRHADIPEVLVDGVSGLLAEESSSDDLAEKLLWLVEHCGDWRRMTDAARARMEAEFDAEKQGVKLAAHYLEVGQTYLAEAV